MTTRRTEPSDQKSKSFGTRVGGSSEYFFDTAQRPEGAAAYNVLGSVAVQAIKDGKIHIKLTIARRFQHLTITNENRELLTKLRPTIQAGSTGYEIALVPGEVTSFKLPPIRFQVSPDAPAGRVTLRAQQISVRVRARQIQ